MEKGQLYKLSAFTHSPEGGNPAGVWIGEIFPDDDVMQQIAAEVGFSETAFVTPSKGHIRQVRYFSPEIEVPFCGHATIATGVLLGEQEAQGDYVFQTNVGEVPVSVETRDGITEASLTSVEPRFAPASNTLVAGAMATLGWHIQDLDPTVPPAKAYAGAWHLVLAVNSLQLLSELDYNFAALKDLMIREELTTLQLIWKENNERFHSRNPFPVGGVVEDPATGAAAAALGGYLREANLIKTPATIQIRQGEAMGRPSDIRVQIPASGGIVVSGTAVKL